MTDIVVPNLSGFAWKDIRHAIKRCVEAVCPDATVITEWTLEFDPATSVGRVTAQMNGKNTHSGFVHCWMMGLQSEQENTNEAGVENTAGGATCDYNLSFALWGFFDYKSWRVAFGDSEPIALDGSEMNAAAFSEHEVRAIKAVFRRNITLGLDTGRVRCVYPLVLETADTHPFSTGKTILIAQTVVTVRVRESFV